MLDVLGLRTLDELVEQTVPASIRSEQPLALPTARTEREVLAELWELATQNVVTRSYLGMGYHGCVTPPVIRRNVLENPGWYTQYTPYQAEISQGRLEALLNFQTMVCELTGLPVANSSLLDEATAAAEAMTLCHRLQTGKDVPRRFFLDRGCHPQTAAVVRTRAEPLGFEVVEGDPGSFEFSTPCFGALVQNPSSDGRVWDPSEFVERAHAAGTKVAVATDLLACTLLQPPGEIGADIAVGSAQRFGVPMGFGGPHAAFLAAREEAQRKLPGRIVGASRDPAGRPALRLALQTREQHIRRDRATSNICTAQVLLAVVAATYAVYHGPEGLRRVASRVHRSTRALANWAHERGIRVRHGEYFDTLRMTPVDSTEATLGRAQERGILLRRFDDGDVGIALDETVESRDLADLARVLSGRDDEVVSLETASDDETESFRSGRKSSFLESPVFHEHRTETELLRYLHRLQAKDLSLTHSMIPLGSCTMKLNATAEMEPITWPSFADLHPFAPSEHTRGYAELISRLERWLAEITGFAAVSVQPNAGSQGEYAGLLVVRAWHRDRGEGERDVCLIPTSAHGTNPASAVLAGMRVVPVRCDQDGNIDVNDLRAQAERHSARLAALMVTYPSTHGVFEESIREVCEVVHEHGGQVYLDGANMNAMVGLCRPGDFGADVCHLNLHKTFCIPHGGGGPGVGPIGVAAHLAPYLPGHPVVPTGGERSIGAVSAAPWGSAMVLPISYAYIAMMGASGLHRATQVAILGANYVAHRLGDAFPVLYRGSAGFVAHECIVDLRPLAKRTGVDVGDVAKRLMDFGFHAPTVSFPVAGTMMIEPTESESLAELDRFCDALLAIREEIRAIEEGRADREDNPLKQAPHTLHELTADEWPRAYSRRQAAYPLPWVESRKFWPAVGRVDSVGGDRHLVCCWIPEFEPEESAPAP